MISGTTENGPKVYFIYIIIVYWSLISLPKFFPLCRKLSVYLIRISWRFLLASYRGDFRFFDFSLRKRNFKSKKFPNFGPTLVNMLKFSQSPISSILRMGNYYYPPVYYISLFVDMRCDTFNIFHTVKSGSFAIISCWVDLSEDFSVGKNIH